MLSRGAVGFSTHKNRLLSRLIRWFTKYKFSHSFIVSDVVENRVYLLEAEKPQVAFNHLELYDKDDIEYEIWHPLDVSQSEIEHALGKTERMFLKKRYSFASLLGIAIKILIEQSFGRIIRNPLRMGVWCAEADWYYLSKLMPDLFGWMDHTTVSPKDLHTIVEKSGRFKLIQRKLFNESSHIPLEKV